MFVLQIKTGCELSCAAALERQGFDIKSPEKLMMIRRGGIWRQETRIVFPGYIFLDSENVSPEIYYEIKNTAGVINFIGKGKPMAVTEAERQHILLLWNKGRPIEPSKVYTTSAGIKYVMSGLLRNFSGEYIEYDMRQKRARLKVPICGVMKKITLPVEYI